MSKAGMYIIANYTELYNPTNTSGGELKNAKYVKMPVKPRGKGLRTLLKTAKGLETFGIWGLLLQAATETTNPKIRGKLLNHKDEPASVIEIAESISLDSHVGKVQKALDILVGLGWIKYILCTDSVQNHSVQDVDNVEPKISKAKRSEDELSEEKKSIVLEFSNSSGNRFGSDQIKFVDLTCQIFKITKTADKTSMRNVAKFLKELAVGKNPNAFIEAWELAQESIKGDKPIALFISKMKTEMGYLRKKEL